MAGALVEGIQSAPYSARTDADGRFTVEKLSSGLVLFSVTAPGYLTYHSRVDLTASRDGFNVQLIPEVAPFDLKFYRDFARGAQDGRLWPTFSWTVNPSFYLRTVTSDTGEPVAVATLDAIERVFRRAVPELSGGRLSVDRIERGEGVPFSELGSVSVQFYGDLIDGDVQRGGDATIGGNEGRMRLRYDAALDNGVVNQYMQCESYSVVAADHEIVHVMGYFHTDTTHLDFDSGIGCPGSGRSERARYHASVMYSRPAGNTDIDNDPSTFAHPLSLPPFGQQVATCNLERWFRQRK